MREVKLDDIVVKVNEVKFNALPFINLLLLILKIRKHPLYEHEFALYFPVKFKLKSKDMKIILNVEMEKLPKDVPPQEVTKADYDAKGPANYHYHVRYRPYPSGKDIKTNKEDTYFKGAYFLIRIDEGLFTKKSKIKEILYLGEGYKNAVAKLKQLADKGKVKFDEQHDYRMLSVYISAISNNDAIEYGTDNNYSLSLTFNIFKVRDLHNKIPLIKDPVMITLKPNEVKVDSNAYVEIIKKHLRDVEATINELENKIMIKKTSVQDGVFQITTYR